MNLVLLHALPLDERMWDPQRAAFSDHRVTTPNLYRLGETIDEWADGVLGSVGDDLVVVGASMGGYCALAVARRAPDRVRGVCLVGSRPDADPPERRPVRELWLRRIEEEGAAGLWAEAGEAIFGSSSAEVREFAERCALERTPDELARALRAIRDRADATAVVAALEVPFLVVVGDRDGLVPLDVARAAAESAREGRLEVVRGAGHVPSLERPDEFNRLLRDFLAAG